VPELPEVERATRLLRAAVLGRTLHSVVTLHRSAARSLPPSVADTLAGRVVTLVERRAKYQLLHLDDGRVIEVHFKMTGDWAIGPASLPAPALERVRMLTTDGTRVSLVDGRAFAVVRVHAPGAQFLPPLGVEPLDALWTGEVLLAALARKRGPIKPALLDQRVVAGLGNIYAAEALWEAAIHPNARANRLSLTRVRRLADAARLVLERAPDARYYGRRAADDGHTYAIGDGGDERWCVYDREGGPCRRCDGRIRRVEQAGRSTYYCGRCQRV
jgi:formamidopyrimidine-DNA glycosylase